MWKFVSVELLSRVDLLTVYRIKTMLIRSGVAFPFVQETLAKQKRYSEAAVKKGLADDMEASEQVLWKEKRDMKIQSLSDQFLTKQERSTMIPPTHIALSVSASCSCILRAVRCPNSNVGSQPLTSSKAFATPCFFFLVPWVYGPPCLSL